MKTRLSTLFVLVVSLALLSTPGALARGPRTAAGPAAVQQQGQHMQLLAQIGGEVYAVALQGSYAYIGVGPRLVVLDVSDPAHPTVVGQTGILPAGVSDVAVAGDYAYVASAGLRIVDVSNPAAPIQVGAHNTPASAVGVTVAGGPQGTLAYVAGTSSGLRVVDVSVPAAPTEVGAYDTPGSAEDVAIAGQYAYVADGSSGLRIVSISDPTLPVETGSCDTPGGAAGVAVVGSYAYIADGSAGLRILDVSDAASPSQIGFYDPPGISSYGDVVIVGSYAYIAAGSSGLHILDVSDPASPTYVGSFDTVAGNSSAVAVSGDIVYLAESLAGLRILDASDLAAPTQVGYYELLASPWGVAVAGDTAYVSDVAGLHILDISDPAAPARIGLCEMGNGLGVALYSYGAEQQTPLRDAVAGGPGERYAYVAAGGSGLHVVDVSDPVAPVETGLYNTPGSAQDVAVAGGPGDLYAYVADSDAGLRVVDVSDPAAPAEVGFYDTPGQAWDVVAASGPGGTLVYVADLDFSGMNNGLRIIDVSDPAAPAQVGSYSAGFGCWTWGVAVVGNYAYIANFGCGLRIVDVSDPTAPAEVSVWYGADPISVTVAGKYAYVGDGSNYGLRVLNVSDPAAPTGAGFYGGLGNATDVAVVDRPGGPLAYVVDNAGGLIVLRFYPYQVYLPMVARSH